MQKRVIVVIPSLNGEKDLPASIESVLAQTYKEFDLLVVDNGSADNSKAVIESYKAKDSRVSSIYLDKNYGYTGGVNPGMELAIKQNAEFVAPFNNDAVADKDWLKMLVEFLRTHPQYGIATCTLLHLDGKTIDSTADQYTIWGIPYPRGRDEPVSTRYDRETDIFGASGGASLYRVKMLKNIGVFDQDFFAYYEDIDLSFRAQLAGWKVSFVPKSIVYHAQGKTTATLAKRPSNGRGATTFTTKQYMKNLPYILVKDMPARLLIRVLPRFAVAYTIFFVKAFFDHRGGSAARGLATFWIMFPKKLRQRRKIQRSRKVSDDYLWGLFLHDLPPNASKLKKLRAYWWRIIGKNQT